MKVGDIALKGSILVEILQLDYDDIPVTRKIENPKFFGPKTEKTGDFTKRLKMVWWREVGNSLPKMQSSSLSPYYEWDTMINDATCVIHQSKILLDAREKA